MDRQIISTISNIIEAEGSAKITFGCEYATILHSSKTISLYPMNEAKCIHELNSHFKAFFSATDSDDCTHVYYLRKS